jgi:hypothetical protein
LFPPQVSKLPISRQQRENNHTDCRVQQSRVTISA